MQLHLSPRDGVSIYRQIVNQIKYQIAAGRLSAGEELPPIRVLAAQLVINPNTVARAYLELEQAGLVNKRHGSGTYVSDSSSPLKRTERMRVLTERIDALLAEAAHMNVEVDQLLQLVRDRSKNMNHQDSK